MKSSSRQRRVRPLKAKAAAADAEFESYGGEPNMKLSHAFMVVLALHVVAVGGLFAFNKVKSGHSKVSQKLQTEVAAGQDAVVKEETKSLVPVPVHEAVNEIKQEAHQVAKAVESPAVQQKLKEPVLPMPVQKIAATAAKPALTAMQKQFLATKTTSSSAAPVPAVSSPGAVAAVVNIASSTPASSLAAAPEAAPEAAAPSTVSTIEYTIVKRDNPYNIAKRFHVPYSELIKFNNITDPRKIQIGQKIKIPKKS